MKPTPADIPLEFAIIAWNPNIESPEYTEPGKIAVIRYPDGDCRRCNALGLSRTVGAPFTYWEGMAPARRLLQLYIEAWHIVIRDGVDPAAVHAALNVIPEYRDTLTEEIE